MTKKYQQLLTEKFSQFSKKYHTKEQAYEKFADNLYYEGEFSDAIDYYQQLIEMLSSENRQLNHYSKIAACYYAMKDYHGAIHWYEIANEKFPHHSGTLTNLAIMYDNILEPEKSLALLLKSLHLDQDNLATLDKLASIYGKTNQIKKSLQFGNLSLKLKDQAAFSPENNDNLKDLLDGKFTISRAIPPFNPNRPERNIIAFSLFGNNGNYFEGALINATLAPLIYPGWTCRFYCDQHYPKAAVEQLIKKKSQVVIVKSQQQAYSGLFWRFLVADDNNIDRYIIRDSDAIINCQERVAVDEWLKSNKHFHLMRDNLSHCELILAGLWGGVQGALPPVGPLITKFLKNLTPERANDQVFLRYYLWPIIKGNYLAHDSYFSFDDVTSFPTLGHYPSKKYHVGQNYFSKIFFPDQYYHYDK